MDPNDKPSVVTPDAATFPMSPGRNPAIAAPSPASAAAHFELEPGDVINGRYRVVRLLGEGGIGAVYLVEDNLKSGQQVALKMLQSFDLSPEQVALLKNEFEVMTGLTHPNLAAVYDFELLHGTDAHFFTMEFVPGQSLEALSPRSSKWRDMLDLIVQVCRGLAYMHSRSVIHFDLKPANIMVTSGRKAKVLDFGLSGARAYRGDNSELLVTPAYLAPELAHSASSADFRVDLYSLGIILYQMLTGRLPFPATSPIEMVRAHCAQPIEFDEESEQKIPAWLRRIVIRMCAKEPADRFRSANAIIEEINRTGGLTYEIETRKTRESYLLSSRFVARREEYQAILDHVEQNLGPSADPTVACLVAGISGIGKSRLLREVRHHLQLSQHRFIETNCYDGSLSEFAPMVDAVRHVVALAEAAGDKQALATHGSELAKLDQQLAEEHGLVPSAPSQTPEAERRRIIQHVAEFILDAAQVQEFILYINDLQWARPGTVDILSYLVHQVASRRKAGETVRFCILGSYREDEIEGAPIAPLLEVIHLEGYGREIALRPLQKEDVGKLLGSMLGIESPPDAFVERVHEESGGNPYFVEEIMRTLVESGAVFLENGTWATREDVQRMDLPHSVADALLKRFQLLDEPHRYLLELMAVHARPLPAKVLHRIAGDGPGDLQQRLSTLVSRRMAVWVPEQDTSYRVVHDRLREAVHDAIPVARRQERHGQLAKGLAECYGDQQDAVLYDLARHYWEAHDPGPALSFSLRAAEKAHSEYANDFGIVLYRRVLELLPADGQDAVRRKALENLGEMSFLTGAYDDAQQCYDDVFATSAEPLTQARLRRKQALVHLARGQLDDALGKLWAASEFLGGEHPATRLGFARAFSKHLATHLLHRVAPFIVRRAGNEQETLRLTELGAIYLRLAYVYYFTDPLTMVMCSLIFANASERLGESPQLCHALSTLGVIYGSLSLFGNARRYSDRAIAMSRRLGLPWHQGQTLEFRGMSLFYEGRLDEASTVLDQARQILRDCGDLFELQSCYIHLSYCHIYRGNFAAAVACNTEGLSLVQKTDAMQMGRSMINHAAMARFKLGQVEGQIAIILDNTAKTEASRDWLDTIAAIVFLGDMYLSAGDVDAAITCLENNRRMMEEHGIFQDYTTGTYSLLVRAYWERHLVTRPKNPGAMPPAERKHLRQLSRKALVAGRLGHPNFMCPGLICRGLSLWADGRVRAARRCFRKGLDVARLQRAERWLAEGCFEAGRCLVLSPQTRDEGIRYLQHAADLFAEQGCRAYLQRTRDLLNAEGVSVRPARA